MILGIQFLVALRFLLGGALLWFGICKLTRDRAKKRRFFARIGLRPASFFVLFFGLLESTLGLLLLLGYWVTWAGICAALIFGVCVIIKRRHPKLLAFPLLFYAALSALALYLAIS